MEQQTRVSRYSPNNKKSKFKRFLKLLMLLVIVVAGYSAYQYYQGKKLAGENPIAKEDFVGDLESGKTVNYLLLGIDTRGEEKSRTDTMMIVSWNKKDDTLKLVSLMRDIYADIPGYTSYKLNTAYYLGGVQLAKDTISSMFDIPIHHYAIIDFKNFESMIDILAPKGVDIDVEKDMSENIGVTLKAGQQKLTGQELLGYARFRKDAEGDFGRVRRQQQVVEAVKSEALSITSLPKLPKLVGAIQEYIATDIPSSKQLSTVSSVALSGIDIEKLTIPAEGTYRYNSYSHAGSVIEIDIEKNQQLLHDFLEN